MYSLLLHCALTEIIDQLTKRLAHLKALMATWMDIIRSHTNFAEVIQGLVFSLRQEASLHQWSEASLASQSAAFSARPNLHLNLELIKQSVLCNQENLKVDYLFFNGMQ